MFCIRQLLPLIALAAVLGAAAPGHAQTIIDEWASVKAPPAPELTAVTVNPKTTALLMLDFVKQGLNEAFKFQNPKAKGECGCGESFSV